MKSKIRMMITLLGALLLVPVVAQAEPPPPTPESPLVEEGGDRSPPDLRATEAPPPALGIAPVSAIINVATSASLEKDPAVALCASDQYLAVYVLDGSIYGQRLTSRGSLLGNPFVIYNKTTSGYATQPDVACEWIYDRFVVTWAIDYNNQGADYDVRARGVHGAHQSSGSQLHGAELRVSEDAPISERNPAIACNIDDHTCLTVFEYSGSGSGDIYGQRIAVGSAGISLDGDRFNVNQSSAQEYNPDVTWGGDQNNFLVVWQYLHTTPSNHYRVLFCHVYDTERGTGSDERQHVGTFLVAAADYTRHQTVPSVAYNRYTQRYLVVFQYDYYGNGADYDVYARRVSGTGQTVQGDPFSVAGSSSDETGPVVAFSGGTPNLPGSGADQFLVAYLYGEGNDLYARSVKGSYASSGSQLDGGALRLYTRAATFGSYLDAPDVTGSVNNGHYMVLWQNHFQALVPDDNVFGCLVAPYAVYVPLVIRNG